MFTIGNLKKRKKYLALKKVKYSLQQHFYLFICIAIELRYFWRIQSVIIGDCNSNNSNCKFVLISALNRMYRKDDKERDARITVKSKNNEVDIVCIFHCIFSVVHAVSLFYILYLT